MRSSYLKMPDSEHTTDNHLPSDADANKTKSYAIEMDSAVKTLQQQLATWICPKCSRHYSRSAEGRAQRQYDDCGIPLLDAARQNAA